MKKMQLESPLGLHTKKVTTGQDQRHRGRERKCRGEKEEKSNFKMALKLKKSGREN
jgi:hypothetical protein